MSPFTIRKAAQALRGETRIGRGEMEKRLLIDRQETQLAVIRTQVGVLIYIQEKSPNQRLYIGNISYINHL